MNTYSFVSQKNNIVFSPISSEVKRESSKLLWKTAEFLSLSTRETLVSNGSYSSFLKELWLTVNDLAIVKFSEKERAEIEEEVVKLNNQLIANPQLTAIEIVKSDFFSLIIEPRPFFKIEKRSFYKNRVEKKLYKMNQGVKGLSIHTVLNNDERVSIKLRQLFEKIYVPDNLVRYLKLDIVGIRKKIKNKEICLKVIELLEKTLIERKEIMEVIQKSKLEGHGSIFLEKAVHESKIISLESSKILMKLSNESLKIFEESLEQEVVLRSKASVETIDFIIKLYAESLEIYDEYQYYVFDRADIHSAFLKFYVEEYLKSIKWDN